MKEEFKCQKEGQEVFYLKENPNCRVRKAFISQIIITIIIVIIAVAIVAVNLVEIV